MPTCGSISTSTHRIHHAEPTILAPLCFDDIMQPNGDKFETVTSKKNPIESTVNQKVNDVRPGRKHQQTEPLAPNFSWMYDYVQPPDVHSKKYAKLSEAPQIMKSVSAPPKLTPKPVFKPQITNFTVPNSSKQIPVQSSAAYKIPSTVSSTVHSNPRENIKKSRKLQKFLKRVKKLINLFEK